MELFRVEIPQYIREVKLSDKQRPIFYLWDGMHFKAKRKYILKKFLYKDANPETANWNDLNDNYGVARYFKNKRYDNYTDYCSNVKKPVTEIEFNKESKWIVIDFVTNEPVVANYRKVGTPKYIQIKGQDIYSGNVREHTRGVVMDAIKESFKQHLQNVVPVKDYPIRIIMELHDTIDNIYGNKDQRWDVDNRAYPYCKAFPDVLSSLHIIEDDDRTRITQPPVPLFCPIDNADDRKLVFIVEKDTRDIVANLYNPTREYFLTGKKAIISFPRNKEVTKVKLIKPNNEDE